MATKRHFLLGAASLFLLPTVSHAALDIQNLNNIQVDSWSTGVNPEDLVGIDDFCIISQLPINNVDTAYGYHARLFADSGEFIVSSGANDLPISFAVKQSNGAFQNFDNSGSEIRYFSGARNCGDADAQLQLQVSVDANDMQNAQPGLYNGSFRYEVEQTDSSDNDPLPPNPGFWDLILEWLRQQGETTTDTSLIQFQVDIPELIQLSGLQNTIDFGSLGPQMDASQSIEFCVYRNGLDGSFKITATGDGDGNAFLLNNSLPYQVFFSQGGSFQELTTPGDYNQITGMVGHKRKFCNGTTNTTLRLDIKGASLAGMPPGNYNGVLSVIVTPQ